jgi:hypothetical protein
MQDEFVGGQSSAGQAEGASAQAQPQVTSLDSLSEFEFQGEKWTPDRFQEVVKGYKTLSEQQKQSHAEDRYWSNLDTDIDSVLADPSLAEKFKSIYPQKFHRVLERELAKIKKQEPGQVPAIPKEYLSKVDRLEQMLQQQAIEAANAKLDATLPKLYEKYPMANEDQVLARAEAFLSQGGKLSDQVWERLAKESHEAQSKKADAFYKKQLQSQLDKGLAGKDAPSGGQAPGKAPSKPRTFDEAQKAMIEHLHSQGLR